MAHFGQLKNELGKRLQNALGLQHRDLLSIDVSLHLADDELVTIEVKFVEAIDEEQQEAITGVHEWMAEQDVEKCEPVVGSSETAKAIVK